MWFGTIGNVVSPEECELRLALWWRVWVRATVLVVRPIEASVLPRQYIVWLNDDYTYSDLGLKGVASHELGHVFGLDEAYVEGSPPTCNGAITSVMDVAYPTSHCDSIYSPNYYDISWAQALHQLNPMTQLVSSVPAQGVMALQFYDPTWADSYYNLYAYRWNGVNWVATGQNWHHTDKVGWADWTNTSYYIKAPQPAGYYRVCGYTNNAVRGNQYWVCFPAKYMS